MATAKGSILMDRLENSRIAGTFSQKKRQITLLKAFLFLDWKLIGRIDHEIQE